MMIYRQFVCHDNHYERNIRCFDSHLLMLCKSLNFTQLVNKLCIDSKCLILFFQYSVVNINLCSGLPMPWHFFLNDVHTSSFFLSLFNEVEAKTWKRLLQMQFQLLTCTSASNWLKNFSNKDKCQFHEPFWLSLDRRPPCSFIHSTFRELKI